MIPKYTGYIPRKLTVNELYSCLGVAHIKMMQVVAKVNALRKLAHAIYKEFFSVVKIKKIIGTFLMFSTFCV